MNSNDLLYLFGMLFTLGASFYIGGKIAKDLQKQRRKWNELVPQCPPMPKVKAPKKDPDEILVFIESSKARVITPRKNIACIVELGKNVTLVSLYKGNNFTLDKPVLEIVRRVWDVPIQLEPPTPPPLRNEGDLA